MTYKPFLIANFSTGLDKELQPWLIPDDAQELLYDGYLHHGVMIKRPGYRGLATGEHGDQPYCESRMVGRIESEPAHDSGGSLVQGDGTVGPYTFQLQMSNTVSPSWGYPIRRGTVSITDGVQTVTDNGAGVLGGDGSGTINYTTGVVVVSFNAIVGIGVQIFNTYDYHPGFPVLGVMNFTSSTNQDILLVADTKRINKLNTVTNMLESVTRTLSITGITQAANGVVTTSAAHNLSTGDRVFIYGVLGMDEVNNVEYTITVASGTTFQLNVNTSGFGAYSSGGTTERIYTGINENFWSWVSYPDKDGNPRLLFANNKDQIQYYAPHLSPTVGNYVNYPTAASPDFAMTADGGGAITTITCLDMAVNKDRLLLLRTTENGVVKPRRIRISGTGSSSDDFQVTATGAGFIDIVGTSWIQGSDFNRDDLIIATSSSFYAMQYTNNDVTPFSLSLLDGSRGSDAPFAIITYLNRTSAISKRGMIVTDGYRVERSDDKIPDFTIEDVDGNAFNLCFAGSVDEVKQHWLIYPTQTADDADDTQSSRVLVTNYEEDSYSIYRLPLSCMGRYIELFDITWNDLLKYNTWDEFAEDYSDWNHFAYGSGEPFSVGGGHSGEVWKLGVSTPNDNPQKIRNITIIDSTTLQITTDYNNFSLNSNDPEMGSDYIYLTGISGMVEANNQQYPIISVTDNYTFRVRVPDTSDFTAYTSGGVASRVIPFAATFKKFNPFVNSDKKVRCGWIYFYVESTGTSLDRNIAITNATKASACVITTEYEHNLQTTDIVSFISVGGMIELNGNDYQITVLSPTTFSLDGIDSSGYTAYTSGGFASASQKAKLEIDILKNDKEENIQTNVPIVGTCTNLVLEEGTKKWFKSYINQVGRSIQFRIRNQQAGTQIKIHATMPGFQPLGRLI